jgi:hypothetical protein
MFGVPVALSGNHHVIYIFTCLRRWVRTRKQKKMNSGNSMFTASSFGLRSFRGIVTDLESTYYLMLHLPSQASKAFHCGNKCEPRKQNTSRRLVPGLHGLAEAKRLRFRRPLTLERIQADPKTFAISYGIRTHIDRMAASSCVDNEPDES